MEKITRLQDSELDQMLDIQEDDDSGPGLSEDEHQPTYVVDSPRAGEY